MAPSTAAAMARNPATTRQLTVGADSMVAKIEVPTAAPSTALAIPITRPRVSARSAAT